MCLEVVSNHESLNFETFQQLLRFMIMTRIKGEGEGTF